MSKRRETGWLLGGLSVGLALLGWIGAAQAARVDGAVESVRVEPGAVGDNRVTAVIRNAGDAPLGKITVTLTVTRWATLFQEIVGRQTREVEGPLPGRSAEVVFTFPFKDTGGYIVEVGVNPPWDRNALNNIASADVYIEKTPSAAVSAPPRRPPAPAPAAPRPPGKPVERDVALGGLTADSKGEREFRLTVIATNIGKLSVSRVDLDLTFEREGMVEGTYTRHLPFLKPGESRSVQIPYLCEKPGSVAVGVRLLAEGDEDPGNDAGRITVLCR